VIVTVVLTILYVLVCLFLILVVLLQQGKGADLAGAFGGGGSQTSFGPRSTTNIMHRLTSWSFVAFVVLSLALAVLTGRHRTSVMEGVAAPTPAVQEAPAEPLVGPAAEEQAPAETAEPSSLGESSPTEEDAGTGSETPS
jgi:preprotein translocase subunit SecG